MTNQQTTEPTDSTTYRTIKEVLDSWSDTQINLASDSARVLLALAIHERVDSQIKQLIEDLVCPPSVVDY
jgi:flagellar basal body-associated protein FliL